MYQEFLRIHPKLMKLISRRSDMAVIRDRPSPELAGRVTPHHFQHLKTIIQVLAIPIEESLKFFAAQSKGVRGALVSGSKGRYRVCQTFSDLASHHEAIGKELWGVEIEIIYLHTRPLAKRRPKEIYQILIWLVLSWEAAPCIYRCQPGSYIRILNSSCARSIGLLAVITSCDRIALFLA